MSERLIDLELPEGFVLHVNGLPVFAKAGTTVLANPANIPLMELETRPRRKSGAECNGNLGECKLN